MIFVTVGGMRGFERLVREMDRIAREVDERVVMQIGPTDYLPGNCEYFRFMSRDNMRNQYAEARLVVCHAGTGSILAALEHARPLVLVPRLREYGEVIDDHQLELAAEMERRGVPVVYDIANLEPALRNIPANPPEFRGDTTLVDRLTEYLDHIQK
ncbi:MAG: beta-1,4-galactosyltransferase [Dehalococcoidia bacterium]|nr:beta-1,4-galactosyltransferase [Dehalococcoidia bacterium]